MRSPNDLKQVCKFCMPSPLALSRTFLEVPKNLSASGSLLLADLSMVPNPEATPSQSGSFKFYRPKPLALSRTFREAPRNFSASGSLLLADLSIVPNPEATPSQSGSFKFWRLGVRRVLSPTEKLFKF